MPDGQSTKSAGLLSKGLEWAALGLGLAIFASVAAGVSAVVHGLWALIWHGHYAGQEFRLAIHQPELSRELFAIDQAWWFILFLPMLAFQAAKVLWECSEWLALSPGERRQRREKARAEAKASSDVKAAPRPRDGKARIENSASQREKMNKRSMSGWRRLWIVLSLLIGVPAGAIAAAQWHGETEYITADEAIRNYRGQDFFTALWQQSLRERPKLADCADQTGRMEYSSGSDYLVSCQRPLYQPIGMALIFGLMPALLMAIIGLVVRWVYRGFRSAKTVDPAI